MKLLCRSINPNGRGRFCSCFIKLGNLLAPVRRHGVVQSLLQRARADEGFQMARHLLAALGRFFLLRAFGGTDNLFTEGGDVCWHAPACSKSPALLQP